MYEDDDCCLKVSREIIMHHASYTTSSTVPLVLFSVFLCEVCVDLSFRVHIPHTDASGIDWLYSVLNCTSVAWEACGSFEVGF